MKLEDKVESTLTLDGHDIGTTVLQVGRPPSETGPNAIRTVDVNFVTLAGVSSNPQLTIDRMSQDWAQAGIRFNLLNPNATPVAAPNNVLWISGSATAAGSLSVKLSSNSGTTFSSPITIPVTVGETAEGMARDLSGTIGRTVGFASTFSYFHNPFLDGYMVAVNPGATGSAVRFAALAASAGVTFNAPSFNYANDFDLDTIEANVLGLNFRSATPNILNVFAVPNVGFSYTDTTPGQRPTQVKLRAFTVGDWRSTNEPALVDVVMIPEKAADTPDAGEPFAAGHEAGHALLDAPDTIHFGPGHLGDPVNLLRLGIPGGRAEGLGVKETYEANKRLTEDQQAGARAASSPGTSHPLLQKK